MYNIKKWKAFMPNINKTNIPSPSAEYQRVHRRTYGDGEEGDISQFSLIGYQN
jgi:hypothetical protein